MKNLFAVLILGSSILLTACGLMTLEFETESEESADLVLHNALVTTQEPSLPSVTAVAVADGSILAVGDDEDILKLVGNDTIVIDGGGRRLIPGLNDNHLHALIGGLSYALNTQWDGITSLSEALQMLTEQAARTPEGHWVKAVGGWSPHQFKENRYPTMDELEAAVPNRPLLVQHAYNVAFVNKVGLATLQQHAPFIFQTPLTVWETNADGEYTGRVHSEPASWVFWLLEAIVPQTTDEEARTSFQRFFKDLNRIGITSVTDGGSFETYPLPDRTMSVFNDDLATIRVSFMEVPLGGIQSSVRALTETSPIAPGENIHPALDHGFQFEAMGELFATDLQTFDSISDFENFMFPIYYVDADKIRAKVEQEVRPVVTANIPFRIHATYDETIAPILDALEEINREHSLQSLRWSIEHAETISLESIARIKTLGGALAIQNRMAMHGDDFIATNGRDKAFQSPPMRAILDAGIPFSLGTDGLRVSSFNPWLTISWATTGKSVSGQTVLGEDSRITREEALFAYTVGTAWHQFQENVKGRIVPGQLADMALLNKDYFAVADEQIKSIHSVLTLMDGDIVYAEGPYEELDRVIPEVLPTWSPLNYYTVYENSSAD